MRALPLALVVFILLASAAAAAPLLQSAGVTSTGSDTRSTYVFTVTYKGDAPAAEVSVVINGVARPMQELDPQDTNYSAGKVYYLDTRLQAGVNKYSFRCVDAQGNATATPVRMLLVKDAFAIQLTHLDVMFAVLVWMPFVAYFIHLARKTTRILERMERDRDKKEP